MLICSRWGSREQKEFFPTLSVPEGQNICLRLHYLNDNTNFTWLVMIVCTRRRCWAVTLFHFKTAGNRFFYSSKKPLDIVDKVL